MATLSEKLINMSSNGLRTLVLGYSELPLSHWNKKRRDTYEQVCLFFVSLLFLFSTHLYFTTTPPPPPPLTTNLCLPIRFLRLTIRRSASSSRISGSKSKRKKRLWHTSGRWVWRTSCNAWCPSASETSWLLAWRCGWLQATSWKPPKTSASRAISSIQIWCANRTRYVPYRVLPYLACNMMC